MPVLFIFAIIFGLIALGGGVLALLASGDSSDAQDARGAGIGVAVVTGLLTGLFLLISSVATVGTQDIAVKTAFGKVTGTGITAGWHWKAPWEKIHQLDAKTQVDAYASNGFNGSTQVGAQNGCVDVRIARQATACVNVVISWNNDPTGVDYLYQQFKTNDNVRDNLLHRKLQTAVNVAFGKFDPLGLDANGDSTQPTNAQLAQTVQDALQTEVGKYLNIQNVSIPLWNFDPKTQDRLNQLQLQYANTRIALQQQVTNKAQAKANEILNKSLDTGNSKNVLASKCLDILKDEVDNGGNVPTGACLFGSALPVAVR